MHRGANRPSAAGRSVWPAAAARPWRITAGLHPGLRLRVRVAVVVVVVVVVGDGFAATAGIAVVDGRVFSAVGSVAGFLSAPGAADRGVISARAAAACRAAGSSPFQRFVASGARDRAQRDEAGDRRGAHAARSRLRARACVVANASVAVRSAGSADATTTGFAARCSASDLPSRCAACHAASSSANSSCTIRRQRHRRQREARRARERLQRDLQRLHRREAIVGLGRQRAQHDLRQRGRVGAHRLGPRGRRGAAGRDLVQDVELARARERRGAPSSARRGSRPARRCRCADRPAGRGTARATCTRTCPSASLPACACAGTPTSRCRSRRPSPRRRTRPARSTARRRGGRCRAARRPGPSRSCA